MRVSVGTPVPEYTWMAFVDGENFTIEAQKIAEARGLQLIEGQYHKKDCFVWLPGVHATANIGGHLALLQSYAIRAYYYTSLVGDEKALDSVKQSLWQLGFSPQVFKKDTKQRKAKGVDIALTKDMLSHAFLGHYEVAILIAGDGDYVPLVEEVKRLGKLVYLCFFEGQSLSPALKLASDRYRDPTADFIEGWEHESRKHG